MSNIENIPKQEIPVHPYAASFPMLEGEELDELVESIRVNGLLHPIVLDKSGQLLDGRNRLKACELAGVKPTTTTIEDDPTEYILRANVLRRHLYKGQRAMAIAMAYPAERGGRGKTSILNMGVSSDYVTKARFVLRYAPDLAAKVMAGSSQLPDAYTHAAEQKREQEEYERLRGQVRDWLDSIVDVCVKLKANADTPDVDQGDFIREVHSEAKLIVKYATQLAEDI
jgi:hypothetical protein